MAPFPETEIMTIKRLEVALRKMDFKLLRDGAYKLHEKYHSGFKFEYLDLLKEIKADVEKNNSVPLEIKNILIPTIEDILENSNSYENDNEIKNHVSSLTSLSYNTKEDPKKAAFEAFVAPKPKENELQVQMKTVSQSPFSAQPFKEFSTPKVVVAPKQEPVVAQEIVEENQKNEEITLEKEIETKTVSVFYSQAPNQEKIKNILEYKKSLKENSDFIKTLELISKINKQTKADCSEFQRFLEQFREKDNVVNIITNSESPDFINYLANNDFSYSLFNSIENKKYNFIPLFGLVNLFKCSNCKQEFLNTNEALVPFALECPQCSKPMFFDLYTGDENSQINLDYYNCALDALANSKKWFLIRPLLGEKVTFNLFITALKVSNQVQEIVILDNDINVCETFKNAFEQTNSDVKITIQR